MSGVGHGQIWWADVDKVRPVLVLTRARVVPRLTRVVVAPVTTVVRGIGTEVRLRRAGRLDADRWEECCVAVQHMMGCG